MSKREELADLGYENHIVFDNPDFDGAIIGVSTDGRVVYDYDLMIEHLVSVDNMSVEEAADFIDYNTLRMIPYIGEGAPIVVNLLERRG